MRDIGKNIKGLRERRGMTQEALAEALFVTRQTVSNYETGRSRPDIDMLIRIAQVLDADMNHLLYGLPPEEERRRGYMRLAIALGGAAVLILLSELLGMWTVELTRKYIGFPQMVLHAVLMPVCWLLLGWCALQGLWALKLLQPLKEQPWVRYARRGMLGLLGIIALLLVPVLVYSCWQMIRYLTWDRINPFVSQGMNGIWSWMVLFNAKYPGIYAAVGGALWLFRFPRP